MGKTKYKTIREYLKKKHPEIYKEVVKDNFTRVKQVWQKFEKSLIQ